MRTYSRKDFLAASGAGVAALALPGVAASALRRARGDARAGAGAPSGYATFVSQPSLKPPTLTVTTLADPAPGYLFVTTLNGPGQRGPMILDNHGRVVWFRRLSEVAINFQPQTYQGKPVVTWWEGTISTGGIGQGENVIVDETYETIARVQAGNGFKADVHEFLLTPQGTALMTIFDEVKADLSSVGGSTSGTVLDSIVQEVDVRTGRVLFEWHSLDHVPLADTYAPVLDPFDYFHANSIDVDLDGNLIVSARNTSAVYKIDRSSGQVLWTLGGRKSNFDMGPKASFMYQHDARMHADGTMTIFDDGPSSSSPDGRAIRLGLDLGGMRADLLQQYKHPTPLAVSAMGNAQVLAGDAVLVGWGTQPWITEFGPGGNVRLDAKFDGDAWNYRAFRSEWAGRPTTRPALAVARRSGKPVAYASWNGSTETVAWRVSTGDTRSTLRPAKPVPRVGFETAIPLAGKPAYVAVEALDRSHQVLARSRAVAVAT